MTLQVPSLESELGMEAGRFLSSAAVNKCLVAIVEVPHLPAVMIAAFLPELLPV